jgi:hypothetical protein
MINDISQYIININMEMYNLSTILCLWLFQTYTSKILYCIIFLFIYITQSSYNL